jgi:thymidylate kinase
MGILDINKVMLNFEKNMNKVNIAGIEKTEERLKSLKNFKLIDIYEFFSHLDARDVPYVSWKNNHELDKFFDGDSDLDIYIPKSYKQKFIKIATKNSWIAAVNPVAEFAHIEHFYNIGDNGKIYHLHVYFKVITGESWIKEFDLPMGGYLIENRRKHDKHGIYVLNDESQAYLFVLRHIIKCGSISSRALYLKDCESYRLEWELCNYRVDELRGHGPILLDGAICNSGLLNDFQLSGFINSFMFRNKISPFLRIKYFLLPIYRIVSFASRAINKLFFNRKKVLKPRGLVIAISGVDGSGKSSMVDLINSSLSSFLTIRRLSLGKPQGKLIEFIRKLFSNNKPKITPPSKEDSFHEVGLFKSISLLVLAVLRLFESWKSQYYINNGYVILVDRWPTREFGKMDGPKIYVNNTSSTLVKLFSKFEGLIYKTIPAADVCFFLEVSVDTAIKRNSMRIKDDKETESEIRERHMENKMIKPITKKFIRFNNDGPLEEKKKELLLLVRHELVNVNIYQ